MEWELCGGYFYVDVQAQCVRGGCIVSFGEDEKLGKIPTERSSSTVRENGRGCHKEALWNRWEICKNIGVLKDITVEEVGLSSNDKKHALVEMLTTATRVRKRLLDTLTLSQMRWAAFVGMWELFLDPWRPLPLNTFKTMTTLIF